jgi:hypothetical protein
MQLRTAHVVLINAAIALAVIFGTRAAVLFARDHDPGNLGLALASVVVGVGLAVYLRTIRAKWAKEPPPR